MFPRKHLSFVVILLVSILTAQGAALGGSCRDAAVCCCAGPADPTASSGMPAGCCGDGTSSRCTLDTDPPAADNPHRMVRPADRPEAFTAAFMGIMEGVSHTAPDPRKLHPPQRVGRSGPPLFIQLQSLLR